MPEENVEEALTELGPSYNRVQFSTFVNGDQFVIRTDSGEEFADVSEGLAENMDRALKAINAFKQVAVANGVFTGDSSKGGAGGGGGKRQQRATDSPPPSNDDPPLCDEHDEPMKDLSGRGYKSRWYCARPRDESRNCKPKN